MVYIRALRYTLIVALDVKSGKALGSGPENPHPVAAIAMSPTFYDSTIFIGSSSNEEVATTSIPGYKCCSVGNIVALTFNRRKFTFHVRWNISMI